MELMICDSDILPFWFPPFSPALFCPLVAVCWETPLSPCSACAKRPVSGFLLPVLKGDKLGEEEYWVLSPSEWFLPLMGELELNTISLCTLVSLVTDMVSSCWVAMSSQEFLRSRVPPGALKSLLGTGLWVWVGMVPEGLISSGSGFSQVFLRLFSTMRLRRAVVNPVPVPFLFPALPRREVPEIPVLLSIFLAKVHPESLNGFPSHN